MLTLYFTPSSKKFLFVFFSIHKIFIEGMVVIVVVIVGRNLPPIPFRQQWAPSAEVGKRKKRKKKQDKTRCMLMTMAMHLFF